MTETRFVRVAENAAIFVNYSLQDFSQDNTQIIIWLFSKLTTQGARAAPSSLGARFG